MHLKLRFLRARARKIGRRKIDPIVVTHILEIQQSCANASGIVFEIHTRCSKSNDSRVSLLLFLWRNQSELTGKRHPKCLLQARSIATLSSLPPPSGQAIWAFAAFSDDSCTISGQFIADCVSLPLTVDFLLLLRRLLRCASLKKFHIKMIFFFAETFKLYA